MNKRSYNFLREQQEVVQIRRISEWNREAFSAYLQNPEAYSKMSNAAAAFGAYQNDIPVGAVELVTEEGYLELRAVTVDEECRRCGVGTALLERAKEFAAEMDVDQIQVKLLNDSLDASVPDFLESAGFYLNEQADTIFSVQPSAMLQLELIHKMAQRGLPKDAVAMDRLSKAQKEKLLRAKSQFGVSSLAGDAEAQMRREVSFGCPDETSGLGAFVLVVQRFDAVCLDAAYADKDHVTAFLRLLAHALEVLDAQGVEELYVTVKSEAFLQILQKITEEKPELLRSRTLEWMSWELEDARMELEARDQARVLEASASAAEGAEILISRLMRLADILEAMEVTCDMMLSEIPYLLIDNRIGIHYYPQDDTYQRFELAFSSRIVQGEQEETEKKCTTINTACRYVTAIPIDEGILVRYAVPEYDAPIGEELFLSYLDTFRTELALAGMYV